MNRNFYLFLRISDQPQILELGMVSLLFHSVLVGIVCMKPIEISLILIGRRKRRKSEDIKEDKVQRKHSIEIFCAHYPMDKNTSASTLSV